MSGLRICHRRRLAQRLIRESTVRRTRWDNHEKLQSLEFLELNLQFLPLARMKVIEARADAHGVMPGHRERPPDQRA